MHCKSLWIKASAKCINVNVNVNVNIAYMKLCGGGGFLMHAATATASINQVFEVEQQAHWLLIQKEPISCAMW